MENIWAQCNEQLSKAEVGLVETPFGQEKLFHGVVSVSDLLFYFNSHWYI